MKQEVHPTVESLQEHGNLPILMSKRKTTIMHSFQHIQSSHLSKLSLRLERTSLSLT